METINLFGGMKRKILFIVLLVVLVVIFLGLINGNKSTPLPSELAERLAHSANFEALALNPIPIRYTDKLVTNLDTILGYKVLGLAKIDDQKLKQELVNAISKDVAEANHARFKCMLEPRHGIRCVDGSNSVLMAICYHCGDVVVEQNKKEKYYLIKMGESLPSPASMELLEKIFTEAGIKTNRN